MSGPKPLTSVEAPDFFKDTSQFAILTQIWDYVRNLKLQNPTPPPRKRRKLDPAKTGDNRPESAKNAMTDEHLETIDIVPTTLDQQMRADLDSYIHEKLHNQKEPLIISLLELSDLIELEVGERPTGTQRRGISEITRAGGRLLIPDLAIFGKIYHWEDLVSPIWIEIGERVSDAYRAAAILFEFAASLTAGDTDMSERRLLGRKPNERKKKLNDILERITVHFELKKEELSKMSALLQIFEREAIDPQNLAVSFQNCLQSEDRMLLRDFFFRLCAPTGDSLAKERDEFLTSLSTLLEVEGRPEPVVKSNISIGEALIKTLKHLFRSEELAQSQKKSNKEQEQKEELENESKKEA